MLSPVTPSVSPVSPGWAVGSPVVEGTALFSVGTFTRDSREVGLQRTLCLGLSAHTPLQAPVRGVPRGGGLPS